MGTTIARSSGNVYADLGIKNPEAHALKAELVRRIDAVMKAQALTQVDTARRLGIEQPDVSKLLRGHFRQFSVERLMRFLVALGQDVEFVVRPAPAARARARAAQLTVTGRGQAALASTATREPRLPPISQ
jgi:predicted XRE-type DNA-binding protein